MTRTFVQVEEFTKQWEAIGLGDETLRKLEDVLLISPEAGDLVQGLHGARKARISINYNHGKSGGARVIYLDRPQKEKLFLISVYTKKRSGQSDIQTKIRYQQNNFRYKDGMTMIEIEATSSKDKEEVDKYFEEQNLYDSLMRGFNEALDYEKGNAKEKTIVRKMSLPDVNISVLRKELNMTQSAFAAVLGVSPRTVESWEAGRTTPSPTAKNLLYLICVDHSNVERLKKENYAANIGAYIAS